MRSERALAGEIGVLDCRRADGAVVAVAELEGSASPAGECSRVVAIAPVRPAVWALEQLCGVLAIVGWIGFLTGAGCASTDLAGRAERAGIAAGDCAKEALTTCLVETLTACGMPSLGAGAEAWAEYVACTKAPALTCVKAEGVRCAVEVAGEAFGSVGEAGVTRSALVTGSSVAPDVAKASKCWEQIACDDARSCGLAVDACLRVGLGGAP